MMPDSAKLEDAVTGQPNSDAGGKYAHLKPCLEILAFGDFPKLSECIDWEVVGEYYAPFLREHLRVVKADPHQKCALKSTSGDTH